MATLFSNTFASDFTGITKVETSGTVTINSGSALFAKPADSWATLGIYMTSAIVAAGGHVVYYDYWFDTNSHCMHLLKDNTGIDHTGPPSVYFGGYGELGAGVNYKTWNGAAAGGTPFAMSTSTWYNVKLTVSGTDGSLDVHAKLDGAGSWTLVGNLATVDFRGRSLRFATNHHTTANYRVRNLYWTDNGVISGSWPPSSSTNYKWIANYNSTSTSAYVIKTNR